jgi:hypothetical protein
MTPQNLRTSNKQTPVQALTLCYVSLPSIMLHTELTHELLNIFQEIFEVLPAVVIKSFIFWDIMPHSQLDEHIASIFKGQRISQGRNHQLAGSFPLTLKMAVHSSKVSGSP